MFRVDPNEDTYWMLLEVASSYRHRVQIKSLSRGRGRGPEPLRRSYSSKKIVACGRPLIGQ
jgi:hypothetical protein